MDENYQTWLIGQRKQAIDDPDAGDRLLDFFRRGATVVEECLFFFELYFGGKLPKRGQVISSINLSLSPKVWW